MVVDERDDVQKKTFTKWINKHLVKVASHDTCTLPWLLLLLMCVCHCDTLCGLTSQKTNQRGLGLSGSVHEEAHPCFPNFV